MTAGGETGGNGQSAQSLSRPLQVRGRREAEGRRARVFLAAVTPAPDPGPGHRMWDTKPAPVARRLPAAGQDPVRAESAPHNKRTFPVLQGPLFVRERLREALLG